MNPDLVRTILSSLRDILDAIEASLDAEPPWDPEPTPDPPAPVPDPEPVPEPPVPAPEPVPDPEPAPDPFPSRSIYGWNLGPQNYWSTCCYWRDLMEGQIYLAKTGTTVSDDGKSISGEAHIYLQPSTLRSGRYHGVNFPETRVTTGNIVTAVCRAVGEIAYFHESDPPVPGPSDTFLKRYENAGCIRLMDALLTNAREPLGSQQAFYRHRNVSAGRRIFRMITPLVAHTLAQQSHSDLWWCFSHEDSDERIRMICEEFAELGGRYQLYVEHSNEVWNGVFPVNNYLLQRAGGDQARLFRLHGERTNEIGRIAKSILGDRVVCVLGSQAANYGVTQHGLSANTEYVDAVAIAPYFGNPRQFAGPWTVDALLDYAANYEANATRERVLKQKELAAAAGKRLVAYEGGAHLNVTNEDHRPVVMQALRSERMAEIYHRHLGFWTREVGDTYCLYNDVYHNEFAHQETEWTNPQPRGQAVLDFMWAGAE